MDEAAEARFVKIENLLSALTENLVASQAAAEHRQAEWEKQRAERQADWEKRQADWEKRQDRLDRRVNLFTRAGLGAVRRNRELHKVIDQRLDKAALNILEITEKLNARIKIEQDRQSPQA
jgi:hypothetical protein